MSNLPTGTVVFDNVSKRYRLGALGTLRSTVAALGKHGGDGPRDFWALRHISFSVEPGDSLGLIGPNGAGKTTALKLLSNITRPTAGRIQVSGRLSSLIELGAGFHPELSGRDNIYLNGAILGLKRQEIQRKLDAIIAFSELERFIDTPVKRYSSGMYVRLGFAVAAHVEPEILLVDEVLAVGDASFRSRCMKRIRELRAHGTTIVFVSHNMHQIREVCASALLLTNGQIVDAGVPAAVISTYERLMLSHGRDKACNTRSRDQIVSISDDVTHLSVIVSTASPSDTHLSPGSLAIVRVAYNCPVPVEFGRVHVAIYQSDHTLCCVADSAAVAEFSTGVLHGAGVVEVTFEPLQLTAGQYYTIVRVTDVSDAAVIASCQSSLFDVIADRPGDQGGVFVPRVDWRISPPSQQTGIATDAHGVQHG